MGALAGMVIKTVAVTAAKWGLFGAEMAVKSAMALGNPLMLAGIGAAVASTVAIAALVKEKQKEAEALAQSRTASQNTTMEYENMTAAMKNAVTETKNLAAAEAAAAKIRMLQATFISLRGQESQYPNSVSSILQKVFSLLNTPVNAKSQNWWKDIRLRLKIKDD
jgi:hypothetical protein